MNTIFINKISDTMTYKILIINGPNLNLLGLREPDIYGSGSLDDLEIALKHEFTKINAALSFFQSNHEGAIIDTIHSSVDFNYNGIVINAGAYTHTSIGIRDALSGVKIPFVEVHISNVYAREAFRHHSYLSPIAQAVICGAGRDGYRFAIEYLIKNSV
jgi:3-dehydroquinate dehydratase II